MKPSLADRLARTLIVGVASVWILCIVVVTLFVRHEINHNFDDELVEISHRMIDIAVRDLDQARGDEKTVVASPPLFPSDAATFQLVAGDRTVLLRSMDAPGDSFGVPLEPGFANLGPWRIYTVKHPSRTLFLQLADPLEERSDAVNRTLAGLVLFLVAALPLLAFGLRRIARRELGAVGWLAEQISVKTSVDLSPIALDDLPRELHVMGEHVNRLLERLGEALHVERALATNAAHELRSPLTAVRLRLQTALDGEIDRADVEAALKSLQLLSHRAEKLLEFSRAESGQVFGGGRVSLPELVKTVMQEFRQMHGGHERLRDVVVEPGVRDAIGDIDTLAIALRNLIENALHHGGNSLIGVKILAPCTLVVEDDGPGIAPSALNGLTTRHVRLSSDRAGFGLGLSIVRTVVEKHDGQLQMASPRAGHDTGFEVRIELKPFGEIAAEPRPAHRLRGIS